jgi:hypothetical protein
MIVQLCSYTQPEEEFMAHPVADRKALHAALKPMFNSWTATIPKGLTPEETYKYLIDMIGHGFSQVTADALGSWVGMMQSSGDQNLIFAAMVTLRERSNITTN